MHSDCESEQNLPGQNKAYSKLDNIFHRSTVTQFLQYTVDKCKHFSNNVEEK